MEFVRCNLCGSTESRLRFPSTLSEAGAPSGDSAFRCTWAGYGLHHAIVQCAHCGLVYSNPRWDGREVLEHYVAVADPLYLEEREGRVLTFQRHLRPLHALTGPPAGRRLLDVGAYVGVFVEIARAAGWEALGLEPSHWAVSEARRRGLDMIEGTLAGAHFPEASFDVVTMWDVVEHLSDPMGELQQARRVLKPGGWLVIHTMDIDSLFAKLMGKRWPWLMEMHLYYFSRRTLRRMLARAGFEWVRGEPQGRYLRLGYLMTRVGAFSPQIGRFLGWAVNRLGLRETAVSINLGDLVTVYVRRGTTGGEWRMATDDWLLTADG